MAANRRTRRLKSRRLRDFIHSRRLAQARKTEDAWEAEKAAPVRHLMNDYKTPHELKVLREKVKKTWPTRNKTKRGFGIWGITKSMLSRSRRHLNDVVVAD